VFNSREGYPGTLRGVLGREDSSFYYSQNMLGVSASARWLLSGYRLMQEAGLGHALDSQVPLEQLRTMFQAYVRMPLLVTPSERHPVHGFAITLLPSEASTNK
ncbi:unnamed protein product, partial [Symbiodinium pilosum]